MPSTRPLDADALQRVLAGFACSAPPASGTDPLAQLWRIGRWLQSRGARQPRSVRIVRDVVIVDGRILVIDRAGLVQDLSASRRPLTSPAPQAQALAGASRQRALASTWRAAPPSSAARGER